MVFIVQKYCFFAFFAIMKRILETLLLFVLGLASTQASEIYTVATRHLPAEARINVAIPHSAAVDSLRRYSTVYLLNGHGGNHLSWGKVIDLDSLANALELIIVCPDGMNSWYWDSPVDSTLKMESYISQDLVCWVDSHLPTLRNADQRAITGLSMGGHGALWLAIRHSDIWSNTGSTSGGVDFTPWPKSWNIADRLGDQSQNPAVWQEHTVMSLLDSPALGNLNIIVDCGTEDFFYDVNCRFDQELSARKIPHTFITSPGAHNSGYWHRSIQPQLQYFKQCFERAAKNH